MKDITNIKSLIKFVYIIKPIKVGKPFLLFILNSYFIKRFQKGLYVFCCFGFLLLSSCLQTTPNQILLFPSVGEDTNLPDSDYFYIDLDKTHYDSLGVDVPLYEISTTEEYGDAEQRDSVSNCEIEFEGADEDDPEAVSSETKICILDIMEYDLVVNDLKLTYNIPEGMCRYVTTIPPWHYNYETGPGPSTIYECKPPDPDDEEDDEDDSNLDTIYCTRNTEHAEGLSKENRLYSDHDCGSGAPDDTDLVCDKEKEELCTYRYTDGDEDISCCYGTYRIGGPTGEKEEWDGTDDLKKCLGGVGRTSWDELDDKGFPAKLIEQVSEFGVRGYFEIKNLIEVTGGRPYWSTPIANYHKKLDTTPEKLRKVQRASLPKFLHRPQGQQAPQPQGQQAPQPQGQQAPQLFFEVECLDSAGEVLHKLQMMIREWNTHEEFIDFYSAGGADGHDADVTGEEGDECEYEERGTLRREEEQSTLIIREDDCNDSLDFDDFSSFPQTPYEI